MRDVGQLQNCGIRWPVESQSESQSLLFSEALAPRAKGLIDREDNKPAAYWMLVVLALFYCGLWDTNSL